MSWHDCEECGNACYCDGDDTCLPQPSSCDHLTDGCYDDDGDVEDGGW